MANRNSGSQDSMTGDAPKPNRPSTPSKGQGASLVGYPRGIFANFGGGHFRDQKRVVTAAGYSFERGHGALAHKARIGSIE